LEVSIVEYDEDVELTRYVWHYFMSLMTDFERRVGGAIFGRGKAAASASPQMRRWLSQRWGHVGEPDIEEALADGAEAFRRRVRDRILSEHRSDVFVNRCPRCERVVRTPTARQCFWCGHDWHETNA
jgi:hypothetical protein